MIDLSTSLWGITTEFVGFIPRAEVCCVELNFNISKLAHYAFGEDAICIYKLAWAWKMGHSFSLLFLFSLSYPINCFLFICFLVTTEFVSLTKLGALPNPMHFRYSFSTSSYPGIMLRRPNTPLPPQQALRHQARRYTSSLLTSAHIPQTPAAREETFVECAFYYSILCWKKSESSYQLMMRKDYKTMFYVFVIPCFVSYVL